MFSSLPHDLFKLYLDQIWFFHSSSSSRISFLIQSGKTSYLHLIGTLSIIAQVGSFITADYASLRVFDRILARMGDTDEGGLGSTTSPLNIVSSFMAQSTSTTNPAIPPTPSFTVDDEPDAQKKSHKKPSQDTVVVSRRGTLSSWLQEMTDTAFVLHAVTPRSLVLLDELGRSTAEAEGIGLAWAVCEELALISQRVKATLEQQAERPQTATVPSASQLRSSQVETALSPSLTPALSNSSSSSAPRLEPGSVESVASLPFSEITPSLSARICDPIVLLTTHFPELFQLEAIHPNIINVHLQTSKVDVPDGQSSSSSTQQQYMPHLRFSYTLEYGPATNLDCGIEVSFLSSVHP